jgi:sensor domain CHASE-containing protein
MLFSFEVVGLFILFGIVSIKTTQKLIAEEEEEIRQRIRQRIEEEITI